MGTFLSDDDAGVKAKWVVGGRYGWIGGLSGYGRETKRLVIGYKRDRSLGIIRERT